MVLKWSASAHYAAKLPAMPLYKADFSRQTLVEEGAVGQAGEAIDIRRCRQEIHQVFDPQGNANAGQQFGYIERLGDIIHRAEIQPSHPLHCRCMGGQNDGNRVQEWILLKRTADVKSIENRHFNVKKDDVRLEVGGELQARLPGICRMEFQLFGDERSLHHQVHDLRIVDQQHFAAFDASSMEN